ncbi:putative membrane protein YeaQ/YmgE (transglycosylase-associated protein family) [Microbacterium halimionae]|uniref:Putative membrane protein YeaQ/YmgE (Transglycosylase-associated protein family) n=1 Tax=Microbacterium halimionae TaxID=1526413 RepID=A0A7W3JQX4_9MICO|nr:hypothetical protein [Microbacterium halimionae]MBA8817326.1 putative membrane protein YeaQ/YmgE (transglycosylase-associated protein family) [Microbacterium halimionae]NII95960.1 putative membrane protein YeaQ/YmgE (transglycosylase-associated protein family) [Microbacterium halimionae]
MDILLAFILGATLGLAAHFVLPGRHLRGAALMPLVGSVTGGAVWLALTWLGLTSASFLLWAAAVVVPAAVVFAATVLLTRSRVARDERVKKSLKLV